MQLVANYEIKCECSVIRDDLVLRLQDPRGRYRAKLRNIQRADYSTPFLLSLHLYFEAPALDQARGTADECMVDCLNLISFTTGAACRRHRIRAIVDATPPLTGMRSLLLWADSIAYDDPQPAFSDQTTTTIVTLMKYDQPPAIQRAMRWYRLGTISTSPDDQFVYFWFALEVVAEFRKPPGKVPDRCPHCRSPLFCENCGSSPVHSPYAKQAVRDLLKTVDPNCNDALVDRLEGTRHKLMHGMTLREIEQEEGESEHTVDTLGHLVWRALLNQFPREIFDGSLAFGYPSTYVHRTLSGVVNMQTIVPLGADGDFDLNFKGTKVELVTEGPPESALPSLIVMTPEQYQRLQRLAYKGGDHQQLCQRVARRVQPKDGKVYAMVRSLDFARVTQAINSMDDAEWVALFREIVASGGTGTQQPAPEPG